MWVLSFYLGDEHVCCEILWLGSFYYNVDNDKSVSSANIEFWELNIMHNIMSIKRFTKKWSKSIATLLFGINL